MGSLEYPYCFTKQEILDIVIKELFRLDWFFYDPNRINCDMTRKKASLVLRHIRPDFFIQRISIIEDLLLDKNQKVIKSFLLADPASKIFKKRKKPDNLFDSFFTSSVLRKELLEFLYNIVNLKLKGE